MADNKIEWPGWATGERIGKGGFGSVYEIYRDEYGIQEKAALKVISIPQSGDEIDYLRSEGFDDESITTQFNGHVNDIIKEYKMMQGLKNCPNIVHCDDYMVVKYNDGLGWDIFLKMELLTPLMKALNQVSTERQIIKLGQDLCNALITCQKKSILHRDIKPQNIFVDEDGNFKLGDFGIARTAAKTTRATVGIGTYNFMAPEVLNNQPYGPSADIYSLGLVLYWLSNNRRGPFLPLPPENYTPTMDEGARQRRFSGDPLPAPVNGSSELKKIILKACAYDPRKRYANALEMKRDLDAISGRAEEDATVLTRNIIPDSSKSKQEAKDNVDKLDETISAFPDGESFQEGKTSHTILILAILFIVVLLGAIVLGIIAVKHRTPVPTEAPMTANAAIPTLETTTATRQEELSLTTPSSEVQETTSVTIPNLVNSTIFFGAYEQDNDYSDGAEPIEWIVLAQDGNRVLVISRMGIECKPFHNISKNVTWETCSLRQWLNDAFYTSAFSEEEQGKIETSLVTADRNPQYSSSVGSDTYDKVFLLSTKEIMQYLTDDAAWICTATPYAISRGAYVNQSTNGSWWWLRTSGITNADATSVNSNGTLDFDDGSVDSPKGVVRPAMWINLDGVNRTSKVAETENKAEDIVHTIRECLPIVTYADSDAPKIYGYEDAGLMQKSVDYYFVPATDKIVITAITDDGSAMEVRYPSSISSSGYRSLWFPAEDIVSLDDINVSSKSADEKITTYRRPPNKGTEWISGYMDVGNTYTVLGKHESGYTVVIYSIYDTTLYDLHIGEKLALIK